MERSMERPGTVISCKKGAVMAKVQRASMRGVTGGAGDVLGYGMVGPRVVGSVKTFGEPALSVVVGVVPLSGTIIAEGAYCEAPAPRTDGIMEPTPERRAKGDLVWGVWTIVENVRMGIDGHLKATTTTVRAWHRADRVVTLLRQKVINDGMAKAARELARLAEAAGMVGLRSNFGGIKVDGLGGGRGALPTGAGTALAKLQQAVDWLGGTDSLQGGIVWLVSVEGMSLRQIEGGTTWTSEKLDRKQATGALCAGLDLLARKWGLQDDVQRPTNRPLTSVGPT